ncbi:hypothetical protein DSM07_04855 [Oenococcus sp. UCMA 16435]|nr:hypothetical protein DSM07_04855 [Oenococcus sp. UCMA 16435]MDI4583873.1 hypothetical protein [Oenococcus sp. UCMA 14587]
MFKHSQNTYASSKTLSGNQIGSIPVFWKQNKVLLQTMDHYYRHGDKTINGTYTISSTKQLNKKVIVNQLSRFFSVSPKNLLTSKYNSITGFINIYLMLFALIIVMFFLVLAIVIVYAPLAQVKEIGIKKLNGISNSLIFWDFIKTNTYLIVITSFIIDSGVCFYFNYRPAGFILILVLFQLAILALFLALNSFAYLIIKRVTISKMLKNFLNFKLGNVLCLIMKAFMTLLVTGLIILLSDNIQALIKQNQLNNNWQKYGNVLTLNQFRESNQESQDYLLGGHKTADKIFSLFTRLEKSTKAMYINGEVINPIKNLITQKGYSSIYKSKQTFQVMTVNENYLKYTHNKKLILARNKNNVRQFLVPSSYKKQSKKIKYLCQNLIFNDLTTKEQKISKSPISQYK